MQIFTKLSNRFKYSKRRKSQTSAQTRLTAKTIYAAPGNSVIIDASLADKLTLYWGELSHCATRTPGSVTAIAIVPTSLHPIYRASRLQDVKRHVACADQSPSRMDEGDLNAVILVNRHDRKRPPSARDHVHKPTTRQPLPSAARHGAYPKDAGHYPLHIRSSPPSPCSTTSKRAVVHHAALANRNRVPKYSSAIGRI